MHKYLGLDKIIDQILSRLGDLQLAFIVGDYSIGKDTGTIELVLVGDINEAYLDKLVEKARGMLLRNIRTKVISRKDFDQQPSHFDAALLVWGEL